MNKDTLVTLAIQYIDQQRERVYSSSECDAAKEELARFIMLVSNKTPFGEQVIEAISNLKSDYQTPGRNLMAAAMRAVVKRAVTLSAQASIGENEADVSAVFRVTGLKRYMRAEIRKRAAFATQYSSEDVRDASRWVDRLLGKERLITERKILDPMKEIAGRIDRAVPAEILYFRVLEQSLKSARAHRLSHR